MVSQLAKWLCPAICKLMDRETVRTYDSGARGFAEEWEEEQAAPADLQAVVRQYFRPGPTIDVGCGSGRDTAWLSANGFDVVGIDASKGLIEEAQRRHPGINFIMGRLPELEALQSGAYQNVLCETVIMHLGAEGAAASARRLAELLMPGGVLYLSWRVTEGEDIRDPKGRLYAAFDTSLITGAINGLDIELDERIVSASSQKVVHRLVARRPAG